jgi:hypothetical protein
VEYEPPEEVLFELDYEGQGVSFENVVKKQRAELLKLLKAALGEQFPPPALAE